MTAVPVMLDGASLRALVVGGGAVATRRALALLDAGAAVRVVAQRMRPELRAAAAGAPSLRLEEKPYERGDIGDAMLVVAATADSATNAAVAADARALSRLVTVASASGQGNCAMAAVHRAGPVVVGITTGGVPGAAMRIRDAVAERIDARYGRAVAQLAELRTRLVGAGDPGAWRAAAASLLDDEFCAEVERGTFAARMAPWR